MIQLGSFVGVIIVVRSSDVLMARRIVRHIVYIVVGWSCCSGDVPGDIGSHGIEGFIIAAIAAHSVYWSSDCS